MLYVYRLEFETDLRTGQITAKLPSLNHTADFGDTAEEAVANLRVLAAGFIEVLLKEEKPVPPSDATHGGGAFLALDIREEDRQPAALRTRPAKRVSPLARRAMRAVSGRRVRK